MSVAILNNPLLYRLEFDEIIYGNEFETLGSYL